MSFFFASGRGLFVKPLLLAKIATGIPKETASTHKDDAEDIIIEDLLNILSEDSDEKKSDLSFASGKNLKNSFFVNFG